MKLIKLSLAAALFTTAMYAGNEAPVVETDGLEISANVAFTSNYVWRGMTQTDDSAAVQGGADIEYMGLYVGVWGSNISWTNDNESSLEADFYAGYANEIAGFSYDLGFVAYTYPNLMDEMNFGEAYLGLGYDFGVASIGAKYSLGVSIGDTEDLPSNWEVSASVPLPMDFSVDAVYGDYEEYGAHYLVGVNYSYSKYDFTLAYTANDGGEAGSEAEQDNIVVTVATSF